VGAAIDEICEIPYVPEGPVAVCVTGCDGDCTDCRGVALRHRQYVFPNSARAIIEWTLEQELEAGNLVGYRRHDGKTYIRVLERAD
jgi:hypothetical protein